MTVWRVCGVCRHIDPLLLETEETLLATHCEFHLCVNKFWLVEPRHSTARPPATPHQTPHTQHQHSTPGSFGPNLARYLLSTAFAIFAINTIITGISPCVSSARVDNSSALIGDTACMQCCRVSIMYPSHAVSAAGCSAVQPHTAAAQTRLQTGRRLRGGVGRGGAGRGRVIRDIITTAATSGEPGLISTSFKYLSGIQREPFLRCKV